MNPFSAIPKMRLDYCISCGSELPSFTGRQKFGHETFG